MSMNSLSYHALQELSSYTSHAVDGFMGNFWGRKLSQILKLAIRNSFLHENLGHTALTCDWIQAIQGFLWCLYIIAPRNTSCYRPNVALIFVANDHFYCKNQSALVACMHNKRLLPLNHTRNQYKLIWHCTLISFCSERLLPQIHTANQLTGIAVLALYINQKALTTNPHSKPDNPL